MHLHPIPAFSDNYIWVLHDQQRALVVDPGTADAVWHWLQQQGLALEAIFVTHQHADHTAGVAQLQQASGARVFGPALEAVSGPLQRVGPGDPIELLGLSFQVLGVAGHTADHLAFFCPEVDGAPLLFCGDTLFSGGCGRLFEGTPAQMLDSLTRLGALPDATRVCCAHEYTLANLKFALTLEPCNDDLLRYNALCEQLREQNRPTLPSTIGLEKRINPFLRSRQAAVQQAVQVHTGCVLRDELAVFTALRDWKNIFK